MAACAAIEKKNKEFIRYQSLAYYLVLGQLTTMLAAIAPNPVQCTITQ